MTNTETNETPGALGFRLPAEWERHEATWIAWPHRASDWPGKMGAIGWAFGEIVRRVTTGEKVRIAVNDAAHEARARRVLTLAGVEPDAIQCFRFPTDRSWTRDSGPMFARHRERPETAAVGFGFNAWAKYSQWKRDAELPKRIAEALGMQLFRARMGDREIVLEGGAIDGNGRGTLLTTEECLLDPKVQVRNPGLGREDMEAVLREYLGVTNVLWLGRGIAGDDTHGHVDDLCRFVNARTIVLCREPNPADPNHAILDENRERLEGMRLEDGSRPEVVALPMPAPLTFDGRRLPASYANFYIANAAVLVPTFNDPNDRQALGILADLIRDRPIIGIHAVDLAWGLGTIHCLTHEQPE